MKTQNAKEDNSLPYVIRRDPISGSIRYHNKKSGKPKLSIEEAFRMNQLDSFVEKHRDLVRDYLLSRASFSTQLVEKRAWYILYILLRFVEAKGHFPRYKEMILLLRDQLRDQGLASLQEVSHQPHGPLEPLPIDKSMEKEIQQLVTDQQMQDELRLKRRAEAAEKLLLIAKRKIAEYEQGGKDV